MYDDRVARKALPLGGHGTIETTPQVNANGKWVAADDARRAQRHRARCYYRGWDGVRREVSTIARTKHAAIKACEQLLHERLRRLDGSSDTMTPATTVVAAGRVWLRQAKRKESGYSDRTLTDYEETFDRYVDASESPIRGLTLTQVNDPQRLRLFLQHVADKRGTGAAKIVRTVLSNVLGYAVDNGVLETNAMRQVRTIKSETPTADARDRKRALTREQRDAIVAHLRDRVEQPDINPRSVRKRRAVADLVAFLAGTGARINEARTQRWDDYSPDTGKCRIRGTKSDSSDRVVDVPEWLKKVLDSRRDLTGGVGLMFASPALRDDPWKPWEQGNSANAVRSALDDAGFPWAVPHTFRRTVATLLHASGVPIVRISDQLGHSDPAMTARVYLGRDFEGDKSDIAQFL